MKSGRPLKRKLRPDEMRYKLSIGTDRDTTQAVFVGAERPAARRIIPTFNVEHSQMRWAIRVMKGQNAFAIDIRW